MRSLLIICIFALIFLNVLFFTSKKAEPVYLPIQPPKLQIKESPNLLAPINDKARQIRSISAKLKVEITGLRQELWGDLAYEKDKNFRLIVRSNFGVELDVGSNNEIFWFWSKRAKPPMLYYCEHSRVNESRLKTPLNPLWLMELLNINEVIGMPYAYNNKLVVAEPFQGLRKITLIDQNRIVGHYLYAQQLVASSENVSPNTIKMIWPDENIYMTWQLNEVKTNIKFDPNNWKVPDYKRKTDMSRI